MLIAGTSCEAPKSADLSNVLADYAARLRFQDLSSSLVAKVKALVLDQLGVIVAGSSAGGIDRLARLARDWGGTPQATIAVYGYRVPIQSAAFVNSAMARARDFDSVHERAILHVGAGCIPSLLAAAERGGRIDGKEFIVACVISMECMIRLVLSLRTNFLHTGRIASAHATNFATALGVTRLLGLNAERMAAAMGICACEVSGSMQPMVEGSELVRIQQGLVAHSAVIAALLAEAGTQSTSGAFEGSHGYFKSYHDNDYDRDLLLRGLGSVYETESISAKYYPCCFLIHSAIEGLLRIRCKISDARKLARVRVRVTRGTYDTTCVPPERKKAPLDAEQALFSLPFALGVAWHFGEVRPIHMMAPTIFDYDVLTKTAAVESQVDEELNRDFPTGIAPSVVEATLTDGSVLRERVDFVKGNPRNPMSFEDCEQKLRGCLPLSAAKLDPDVSGSLVTTVQMLEECPDVGSLLRMLSPPC